MMKQFLKALFSINVYVIVVFAGFSLLKIAVTEFNWSQAITRPLTWTSLVLGLFFVIAVGCKGLIEDDLETGTGKFVAFEKRYGRLLNLGIVVPALAGIILFLYFIAPTTRDGLIALAVGLLLRNLYEYFRQKRKLYHNQADQ